MTERLSLNDFAQLCSATDRISELWRIALGFLTSCGIERVSYHSDETSATDTKGVASYGFPDDWVCHYLGANLMRVDPIPDLAAKISRPFFWSQADQLAQLQPAQLEFLKQLDGADLGDGLAVQVFGPNMRNAYVGMGFGHSGFRPTPSQVFELQCAAQVAHIRYCEITADRRTEGFSLSPREQEILGWIAHGKSNSVIADILGLSRYTVDTFTRRIFDKLEVNDRTTAAIRGLGSGVLKYHQGGVM